MEDQRRVFSLFGGILEGMDGGVRAALIAVWSAMVFFLIIGFGILIYKSTIDGKAIERGYTQVILPGCTDPVWVKPAQEERGAQ